MQVEIHKLHLVYIILQVIIFHTILPMGRTSGTFVIGQDFRKFSGKSGQIISGLDTAASNLCFLGT